MLLTILLVDSTTRNMLMHYGQVTIDNVCAHVTTYVGMHTRGTQDNDMFYYVLVNSPTPSFILLPSTVYLVNRVAVASTLLK